MTKKYRLRHTCQNQNEFSKLYHGCSACEEKGLIRKAKEAFEDMTKTSIAWDDIDVFV